MNFIPGACRSSLVYGHDSSIAANILADARTGRAIIQDFVPLAQSLEWLLGQDYLRERGNKAFISDASPVPFVVNNDGTLSRNAAAVFFESLLEAEKSGGLESDIYVLEVGVGIGLFARLFLDCFRDLCLEHGKDYYNRLCYIGADKSQRMLLDLCRHGVLAGHPGRYRLRLVDALQPDEGLLADVAFDLGGKNSAPPFRAIFLNYLLDCLPAAVLEFDGEATKQLCVRTLLARNIALEDHTDMTLDQLRQRAASSGPKARDDLLEVYGLFASEYDYQQVDYKQVPYGAFAYEYAQRFGRWLLLSYGAIQSLEKLLSMVHPEGFILINDYGHVQVAPQNDFEHQRFSLATFVGVNFALLKEYVETKLGCKWVEPLEDEAGTTIFSRLVNRSIGEKTRNVFQNLFGRQAREERQKPIAKAREYARLGRLELAASSYQLAAEQQPANWVLFNEIAQFLTFSFGSGKAALKIIKQALRFNPTCSADLWSTLGDALFELGRISDSRLAYRRALEINPSDVRARYNLAWVYSREKQLKEALAMIAEAIDLDKTGQFRDGLLKKQAEVLAQLTQRNRQELLLHINLVSRYETKTPDREQMPIPNGLARIDGDRRHGQAE